MLSKDVHSVKTKEFVNYLVLKHATKFHMTSYNSISSFDRILQDDCLGMSHKLMYPRILNQCPNQCSKNLLA